MIWSLIVGCTLLGQADDAAPQPAAQEAPQTDASPQESNPKEPAPEKLSPEELSRRVRRLLRDLRSGTLKDREAAEQALVALGPAVLEELPATDDNSPAELKQRLARVRDRLQRQVAESIGKASLVTVQGKLKLSEVFASLEEQSGNQIVDYRPQFGQEATDPELEVAFENVPFWQALDAILDMAELSIYGYPEETAVAVINREEGAVPHKDRRFSYNGPFRIETVTITTQRDLRMPEESLMRLQFETSWEPKLRPITLQMPLADIRAFDEQGNSIATAGEGSRGAEIVPGTFSTEMMLPFTAPGRDVKQMAKLTGTMMALVPGRVETFRFDNLRPDNRVQLRKAGVTVTLDRLRKNNEVWEFRVIVRFDDAEGALASHRNWVLNNETYLLGPGGKRRTFDSFETVRATEDEMGVAYYYALDGGPEGMSLVYKTPSVIMNLPIEFEITDLPLP